MKLEWKRKPWSARRMSILDLKNWNLPPIQEAMWYIPCGLRIWFEGKESTVLHSLSTVSDLTCKSLAGPWHNVSRLSRFSVFLTLVSQNSQMFGSWSVCAAYFMYCFRGLREAHVSSGLETSLQLREAMWYLWFENIIARKREKSDDSVLFFSLFHRVWSGIRANHSPVLRFMGSPYRLDRFLVFATFPAACPLVFFNRAFSFYRASRTVPTSLNKVSNKYYLEGTLTNFE